jgi:hypothetical protein
MMDADQLNIGKAPNKVAKAALDVKLTHLHPGVQDANGLEIKGRWRRVIGALEDAVAGREAGRETVGTRNGVLEADMGEKMLLSDLPEAPAGGCGCPERRVGPVPHDVLDDVRVRPVRNLGGVPGVRRLGIL